MKVLAVLIAALLPVAAQAARGRFFRQQASASELERSSLFTEMGSMVKAMIEAPGNGPASKEIAGMADGKMDFGEAARQLDGKLPADVAALVKVTTGRTGKNTAEPIYDEASLQKARNILNDMMLKGWEELDNVIFECMGFRQRNRGTYIQVVADLARLGSQIARLGELKVKAVEGISEQNRERKEAEEMLRSQTQEFKTRRLENQNEMTIRKNDLAVFDFVLNLTSCEHIEGGGGDGGGAGLLQVKETKPRVMICDSSAGRELRFDDPQLQAQVERMMTPDAKRALRAALGQTVRSASFVQQGILPTNFTTTTAVPQIPIEPLPVSEEPHPEGQWKKCVDGTPNCGLLHDLMSLEWGKFRDSFDELTAEMNENQDAYDSVKRNTNDQLAVINNEKTKHMESLAAAISSFNADVEESREKEEQKRHLTEEYDHKCEEFRAKITEILHTKICAVRKVRNELLTYSSTTPPELVSDCDFTDWHSKTGECIQETGKVIMCDDSCDVDVPYDQYDPYQCGGLETMKRDIVVLANEFGMECPPHLLERKRRCGQKLCPVDCSISMWSGWSKCSKDCESGVQARTRSILIKPKNGGTICDAAQEERACNTGSCDRDCTLQDWTDWAPCSTACDGGRTTHIRKVLVPIRGQGKCPSDVSVERWAEDTCNMHDCNGDEICTAKQDLIIALDSSGSLRESGFEILRTFAANLTTKYVPMYFGAPAMRIGLALFGNGKLHTLPDGTTTISPAINVEPLTDDFAVLRSKINDCQWERGFTNMAQALSLADVMLSQKGRGYAQSAVLVLSDGKYSFKYQTAERARELKDKNIMVYMAPVTDWEDKELETLKEWASQPWETNYERIPGLAALKYNAEIFIQKLMVKFCPLSLSPSLLRESEAEKHYILVHKGGWPSDPCGHWYWKGKLPTADDCAAAARAGGQKCFAWANDGVAMQGCFGEAVSVSQAQYDLWKDDRTNPQMELAYPCEWLDQVSYDTYCMDPSTFTISDVR